MRLLGSMYYILRQYTNTPLPVPISGGDTVLGEHLKVIPPLYSTLLSLSLSSSVCLSVIFEFSSLPLFSPPLPSSSPLLHKERLIGTLYTAAIKESNRSSRVLALYQVGMIVYSELTTPTASPSPTKPSKLVPEGIDILLATLKVSLLTTLIMHMPFMMDFMLEFFFKL